MKLFIISCLTLFYAVVAMAAEQKKEIELPPFHHVVGVKPSNERQLDKKFKLGDDGELVCTTCHGLNDMDKTPIDEVDTEDPEFLREGPYKPLTGFCYQCHDKKANTRDNIHLMLDEKGDIKEEQCKYCHEDVPDREKDLKIDELKLRLPMESICFGCHLKDPHFNSIEHQVEPSREAMLKHLKKMRKELNIFIPLSDKNEVMCVSCHTPHQRGVIDVNKPAGKQVENPDPKLRVSYEKHPWNAVFTADKDLRLQEFNKNSNSQEHLSYQRIKQESLLRLPAKDGQLCLACHTFER